MASLVFKYYMSGFEPVPVYAAVHDESGNLQQSLTKPMPEEGIEDYRIDDLDPTMATLLFSKLMGMELSWRDPETD